MRMKKIMWFCQNERKNVSLPPYCVNCMLQYSQEVEKVEEEDRKATELMMDNNHIQQVCTLNNLTGGHVFPKVLLSLVLNLSILCSQTVQNQKPIVREPQLLHFDQNLAKYHACELGFKSYNYQYFCFKILFCSWQRAAVTATNLQNGPWVLCRTL